MEKNIKKINAKTDHPISMNDLVKTIDHFKKKKKKTKNNRETRGRAKAFASIGRWVSDDEDSSSSDESISIYSSKRSSSSRQVISQAISQVYYDQRCG